MWRDVERCIFLALLAWGALRGAPTWATLFPGPDTFGYTGQVVAFPGLTDISGTGTLIVSGDDEGGLATLGGPGFNFYGTVYTALSAGTNGYLSTDVSNPTAEVDRFNDSVLPSIPTDGGGGRIYVKHDDLVGSVYHMYFSTSPYSNPGGSSTSANVFQWNNMDHFSAPVESFDFQAVLFDDGNMLLLYGPGDPEQGSGATVGIQNPAFTDALQFSADTIGSIPDNLAVFFQHPAAAVPEANILIVWGMGAVVAAGVTMSKWRRGER